ncbi:hypothetical protein EWM64_g8131, partial [Hericium alpestre]
HRPESEEDSDEELIEAIRGLSSVTIPDQGSTAAGQNSESTQPLIDNPSSLYSDYSTTVIRSHAHQSSFAPPSLSSILTIRASDATATTPATADQPESEPQPDVPTESLVTIDSYYTAGSTGASIAAATEGGSTIRSVVPPPLVHRFTLIKPGAKRRSGSYSPPGVASEGSWSPLEFFLSSGLLGGAKCDICAKRLGRKPILECDDCNLRAHLKCGELAPRDCGTHAPRYAQQGTPPATASPNKTKSKPSSPFSQR